MTAAHWVYIAGVASLLVVMVMRKNVIVPAIIATLLTTTFAICTVRYRGRQRWRLGSRGTRGHWRNC